MNNHLSLTRYVVFQEMADSETELNNWWVENCKDSEKVSLHQSQSAIFELLEGIWACGCCGWRGGNLTSSGQNWPANKVDFSLDMLIFHMIKRVMPLKICLDTCQGMAKN